MSTQKRSDDVFEDALDAKLLTLKECQKNNGVAVVFESESHGSCFLCPKIIGCDIRRQYVAAVYNSMSKGSAGGFEF